MLTHNMQQLLAGWKKRIRYVQDTLSICPYTLDVGIHASDGLEHSVFFSGASVVWCDFSKAFRRTYETLKVFGRNSVFFKKKRRTLAVVSLLSFFALLSLLNSLYPLELPENNALFARVVVDSEGRPLRAFADEKGVWRYPLTLNDVSPLYIEALINYEDRWFWYHPGINPVALLRAAALNLRNNKIVSGGSTLSMQVARLLHPHSRSISGKLYQALRTLQLEWQLSKEEILTLYCNIAPFGGTVEGVQAASFTYLNKPAANLSRAEAALLAVLPQAPTRFRPDIHSAMARKARNKVLDRMALLGVWSAEEVSDAKIENVDSFRIERAQHAPLLSRRLLSQEDILRRSASEGFSVINSTIDGALQKSLEDYLKNYITRFPNDTSAAILVVNNETAEVKAYLGTADFANAKRFGHVDMVRAIRSPGSTLKPFLYAMAMDDGLIHSKSLLADVPRSWGSYRPGNFNAGFSGPVSVTEALQRSLNLPAIEVLERLGEKKFVAALNNGGVALSLPSGTPSLAVILGGVGTSLENLVKGYMAFARNGQVSDLHFVKNAASHKNPEKRFIFSPQSAWIVQNILSGVSRPGQLHTLANTRSQSSLAWKTGTSYGFRDTWAIGFNKLHTIGVWIGRPDGTPIPGSDGRSSAGPLLHAVADHLEDGRAKKIPRPTGLVKKAICWPLGTLVSDQEKEHCHRKHHAWLIKGSVPPTSHIADKKSWRGHLQGFWINSASGKQVTARCDVGHREKKFAAVWPRVLEPWLAQAYRRSALVPSMDETCGNVLPPGSSRVQITGIEDGNIYRSLASDSVSKASVLLQAIGGEGRYHWYINGKHRFSRSQSAALNFTLSNAGSYQIVVVDDSGNTDAVTVQAM